MGTPDFHVLYENDFFKNKALEKILGCWQFIDSHFVETLISAQDKYIYLLKFGMISNTGTKKVILSNETRFSYITAQNKYTT